MDKLKILIKEIKKKKELSDIPDSLVSEVLSRYLNKNKIPSKLSAKEQKVVVKEIRAELRNYVGRFQVKSSSKKRIKLLEENKIKELLKTHSSTKERIKDYDVLNSLIQKANPKSILDLGCGLNPIAIAKPGIYYHAMDIKEEELNLIKKFFKSHKVIGKTYLSDIRSRGGFPSTELTLILKVLDIIDTKGHANATNLMKKIKSQYIIASFSTHTLSGKPMRFPQRKWFEELLEKLNFSYQTTKTKNELFYFIEKQQPRLK